jgi:nitrogen fixation/metabolism regulation signal transduction histidine kinase
MFMQVVLVGILVLLCWDLHRLVHRTNHQLSNFLDAVHFREFGINVESQLTGAGFERLQIQLNEIKSQSRELNENAELKYMIAAEVLERNGIGVLVLDQNGKVLLRNKKVYEQLNVPEHSTEGDLKRLVPGFMKRVKSAAADQRLLIEASELGSDLQQELRVEIQKFFVYGRQFSLIAISNSDHSVDEGKEKEWLQFVQLFSHEILNSVTPIKAISDNLRNVSPDSLSADLHDSLQKISANSDALHQLTDRYKQLIAIPEPRISNFAIDELLKEIKTEFNLQFELSGDALKMRMKADREQMRQVFRNLVLNSREAFPDHYKLKLEIVLHMNGSDLIIDYRDNGPGIKETEAAKVFIPFYSTKQKGSGIGLSLIKQIIWRHRGRIHLRVREKGAHFIIRLPQAW